MLTCSAKVSLTRMYRWYLFSFLQTGYMGESKGTELICSNEQMGLAVSSRVGLHRGSLHCLVGRAGGR